MQPGDRLLAGIATLRVADGPIGQTRLGRHQIAVEVRAVARNPGLDTSHLPPLVGIGGTRCGGHERDQAGRGLERRERAGGVPPNDPERRRLEPRPSCETAPRGWSARPRPPARAGIPAQYSSPTRNTSRSAITRAFGVRSSAYVPDPGPTASTSCRDHVLEVRAGVAPVYAQADRSSSTVMSRRKVGHSPPPRSGTLPSVATPVPYRSPCPRGWAWTPRAIPPGQYYTDKWPVLHAGSVPRVDLATWTAGVRGGRERELTSAGGAAGAGPRRDHRRHPLRDQMDEAGHALEGRTRGGPARPGAAAALRAVRDRPRRAGLHREPADRGGARRRRAGRARGGGHAADARSRPPLRLVGTEPATSGRAPSGCAGSSWWRRTGPVSGKATGTTTTPTPGARSGTGSDRVPGASSVHSPAVPPPSRTSSASGSNELVEIDSPSGGLEQEQVCEPILEWLAPLGCGHEWVAEPDNPARSLVVTLAGDGGGAVALLGHPDTVFPPGTAAVRPSPAAASAASGPGVADMKGGLVLAAMAVERWAARPRRPFGELRLLVCADEEVRLRAPAVADSRQRRRRGAGVRVRAVRTATWCPPARAPCGGRCICRAGPPTPAPTPPAAAAPSRRWRTRSAASRALTDGRPEMTSVVTTVGGRRCRQHRAGNRRATIDIRSSDPADLEFAVEPSSTGQSRTTGSLSRSRIAAPGRRCPLDAAGGGGAGARRRTRARDRRAALGRRLGRMLDGRLGRSDDGRAGTGRRPRPHRRRVDRGAHRRAAGRARRAADRAAVGAAA